MLTFLLENGEIYSAIIAVLTVNAIILFYVWFAFDEEKFAKTVTAKEKYDDEEEEEISESKAKANGKEKENNNLKKRRNL